MKEKDHLDSTYTSSDLPQFEEPEKWLYSYVSIEIGKVLSEIKM